MKLYTAVKEDDRYPIISACFSAEDCVQSAIKVLNERGFTKSLLKGEEKSKTIKFDIVEFEEIYSKENGIDYTDDKYLLTVEITLSK